MATAAQAAANGSAVPRPRAVGAGALALAAVCVLSATAPAADAPPQQQLEQVERSLEQSRARHDKLDADVARAQSEVADVKARLVRAAAAAQAQEDAVADLEGKFDDLRATERQKTANLERRRGELAATLSALARLTRTPPEALIASPDSAVDTLRSSMLLGQIVPELEQRADALKRELASLADVKRRLGEQQQRLGVAIGKLDGERQGLDRLLREKARIEQQATTQAEAESQRLAKLAEQAKDLHALVDKLAEEERRRSAEQARAQAEAKAEAEAARKRLAELPPAAPEAGKTGMPAGLPARGRLVAQFGQANNNGVISKGITIETRPNAEVIAPADGRIVFAGPFRGYGHLLIIEHGDGYHTLMAGFARIDGAVGQSLVAGEPVGQMGGENGPPPLLYVEVRRKGEPINPLPWLAASERKVSG
jgi:septal ring factor EnvC (AmiA/AmiB activator)